MIDLSYETGNLIEYINDSWCDVAVHGANCFHVMGAGVALQLNMLTNGNLLEADKKTRYGDINKLGSFSNYTFNEVDIYNLYSQYTLAGCNQIAVHWESVYKGLYAIIEQMESGQTLAVPYIGCGLAGGNKADFNKVIQNILDDEKDLPDVYLIVIDY
jgi:O-acetyl-ADP-ribose deacetylase (regulator of RNase III)